MSGLLSSLVGVATAALNLRSPAESAPRGQPGAPAPEAAFGAVLSAALAPRHRGVGHADSEAPAADSSESASAGEELAEGDAMAALAAPETAPSTAATGNAAAAAAPRAAGGATASDGATAAVAAPGAAGRAAASDGAVGAETARGEADEASPTIAAEPAPTGPNPTRVANAMDELNPEFRARLDRVIARMESEFGHEVRVVETVRDQSRQEYLYAQGRTRPGPVVTWTRSSNHTHGRAADLLVDGTYDNPLAMVRLARIAREEGLRTLGAKDPGHVELPAGARVERLAVNARAAGSLLDGADARAVDATRALATAQEVAPRQVAGVAQVARVAEVARVASVARVGTPGASRGGAVEASAPVVLAAEPAPAAVAVQQAASGKGTPDGDGRRDGQRSHQEPLKDPLADTAPRVSTGNVAGFDARGAATTTADVRGVPGSFGADAAERIARVLQLQDAAPSRPLTQMVLRLDNAVGGEDRIRVDLRGTSVGAALTMGDPVAAARMRSELGVLQRALEGKGLQAEHLSVTGANPGRELADALRTLLPSEPGQRGSQDPESQRESWNGRSGGKFGEAGAENPRQRPRKDSQQGRTT